MHYASHLLMHCIALWCAINGGGTARSAVSPEILANFAKNVASVISPAILGEIQTRTNRSSFESNLADQPAGLNGDSDSTLDNIVDRTSNVPTYYDSRINSYNGLYEDVPEGLEGSRASGGFEGPLRGGAYLRQERPNLYDRPYILSPSNGNFEETRGTAETDVQPVSISHIGESSSNRYSAYHGVGHGPSPEAKPGFPGFGPYGHFPGHHHYHHHHHPDHYGNGEAPADEAAPEENARFERNGTNRRGYGPPYFGDHGYHHSYSSFPYGGYHDYDPFYGPHRRGENDSSANGRPYGPYRGGPDFYGPYDGGYNGGGYGYGGYGYGGRNNNANNGGSSSSSRQTEEPAENGDRNNGTKNGYPGPYGPHLFKPFLGGFHGFPYPFKPPPYDHHFLFKGGSVAGVGHVGYPIYADPYLIGFPFHHPYGPPFYGKHGKYLPPDDKPSDSGEQTEAPAGELAENADPGRITALNVEESAPAPSSNRYKASLRKSLKRLGLDIEKRKV